MKEPIVRTIVIEERQGKPFSVRFTPNPKEFEINSRADALHNYLYGFISDVLKEMADKESDFSITVD